MYQPLNMILAEHYFNEVDWQAYEVSRSRCREEKAPCSPRLQSSSLKTLPGLSQRGGLFLWVTFRHTSILSSCFLVQLKRELPFVPGVVPILTGVLVKVCACAAETPGASTRAIRRLSLCVHRMASAHRAFLEAGALPESSHS